MEDYQMLVVIVSSFASTFWICCKVAPTFTTTGFETLTKVENMMKILFTSYVSMNSLNLYHNCYHSHQGLAYYSSHNWRVGVLQAAPHWSHLQFCSHFDRPLPNWQKWEGGRLRTLPWSLQGTVAQRGRMPWVELSANWRWSGHRQTGFTFPAQTLKACKFVSPFMIKDPLIS